MNFFEHQHTARRNTKMLVLLMVLAVLSLIIVTALLVMGLSVGLRFSGSERFITAAELGLSPWQLFLQSLNWELLSYIAIGVSGVVAIGSFIKWQQLRGGGKAVAQSMGGILISMDSRDPDERKILNVVEEMAIASGTPVPPVYLLEDQSINAFAAGYQPQDAVIGITRGCIQLLNRDELQGVVAHEFSHILHGDMRLNIRLVGILNGILFIGLVGELLLRSAFYNRGHRRRDENKGAAAQAAMGLGLIVVGYAGIFFGNLIKSAVSRQREFLADASAVQFTRQPEGISGALQKIGGYQYGSKLQSPSAAEFSHMYFGEGVVSRLGQWMSTHPPLPERIKRVDPRWNGRYPTVHTGTRAAETARSEKSEAISGFQAGQQLEPMIEQIGSPQPEHLQAAHTIMASLPPALVDGARNAFSARTILYAMLLDKNDNNIRQQQWQHLRSNAHPVVFKTLEQYLPTVDALPVELRLPLVELAIPSLKNLSPSQRQVFMGNLAALIKMDNKVELFEWALYRIISHNVNEPPIGKENLRLSQLHQACTLLLSTIAYAGHGHEGTAKKAFRAGATQIGLTGDITDSKSVQLPQLDAAIKQLQSLKPLQKPLLLKAIAQCIEYDQTITATEAELFRAIADSLNCPVPPLVAS